MILRHSATLLLVVNFFFSLSLCESNQVQTLWFNQQVDHFNHRDQRNWPQRFYLNASFVAPTDPAPVIFFELGWEAPLESADVTRDFYLWHAARRHRAVFVAMEHRFYGASQPLNGTLRDDQLHLITTEQALADFAALIVALKSALNRAAARVIVDGCSYSGELAAMMRVKYPHLVDAAIAGSPNARHMVADMRLFLPHSVDAISFLQNDNGFCVKRIAEANQQLQLLTSTAAGLATVDQMFVTCSPLTGAANITHFYGLLLNAWYWANIAFDSPSTGGLGKFTIAQACALLTNTSQPAVVQYALLYDAFIGSPGCFDVNYDAYVAYMRQATSIESRPLLFEVCNELGSFLTTNSTKQPWFGVPVDYYRSVCKDVFDIDLTDETIQWTFGGHFGLDRLGIQSDGADNILVVNGMLDGGWPYAVQDTKTVSTSVVNVANCGHCGWFAASANPAIVAAQQAIETQIDNWIGNFTK